MKLTETLREIKQSLPETELKIRLKGSYVDDPGLFDPYTEEKKAFDEYELAVDPENDVFKVSRAVRKAMNLKILNQVRNEKTFAKAMSEIAADSFLWCDIFIGTELQIADSDADSLPLNEITANLLAPLSIFVR